MRLFLGYALAFCSFAFSFAQQKWVEDNYTKCVYNIPMRDGTLLYTQVYIPRDASAQKTYPMLMQRTCYGIAPYGEDNYPLRLGPSEYMMKDKYIFVYQDVRGRWMSGGVWTNMTPNNPKKSENTSPDESSDTYDTIEWLLKNIPDNNGKVGQWGISYPGFYTTAGIIDAHPALKAASPQAPVSDFFFDDFHHNGAFTQAYLFTFPVFGKQKTTPTSKSWYEDQMLHPYTKDGYQYMYDLGPLKNVDERYPENFFWKELTEHPNYDEYWQKRNILPHLKKISPAVMVVGGWFDAEDLYGALKVYKTIEKKGKNSAYNTIVMGPFGHGDWARGNAHTMHSNIYFGDSISSFYQKNIESVFFKHFLKDSPKDKSTGLPEAYMFDTGKKQWSKFDSWPPESAKKMEFYLGSNGKLSSKKQEGFLEYISDPMKPVPYTEDITTTIAFTARNYMSEDQRFAARRPDVLVYETEVLDTDITMAGELKANLMVSTTATDADWVVKLIDVYPTDEPDNNFMPHKNITLSNYHQMVRSEAMRGRFRKDFSKPEPFESNKKTKVSFELQDIYHTFKKGHKIQVQVQSTWFPLIDRNPQKYVPNIYKAENADFIKATHRVYADSYIEIDRIEALKNQ